MNLPNITNIFSAMVDNPMVLFPLIAIVISYSVAFLLYFYSPKHKNIFVFLSVPSVIAIIGILINFYNQTCLMVDTFPILWMFIVSNVTLIASGALVKYQLK